MSLSSSSSSPLSSSSLVGCAVGVVTIRGGLSFSYSYSCSCSSGPARARSESLSVPVSVPVPELIERPKLPLPLLLLIRSLNELARFILERVLVLRLRLGRPRPRRPGMKLAKVRLWLREGLALGGSAETSPSAFFRLEPIFAFFDGGEMTEADSGLVFVRGRGRVRVR